MSEKEKGELEAESEEEVCGICLHSSGDRIIRGYIDSCDHYFCFVCIMEWSKVESKCPICKRRFSQIRRPPKPGLFIQQRILSVPIRDQVYYHFGNASVGPPNLYWATKCSVCQSGTDESLLLLCDLCDIASHSYCIGLGATVPEGDWYCPDCALLKAEHTVGDGTQDGTHLQLKLSCSQHHDSRNQISSSCTIPSRAPIGANNNNDGTQSSVVSQAPMVNARTLGRCRNVHDRIRELRANWNNIRNGFSSFTSPTANQTPSLQQPVIFSSSGEPDPSSAHGGASGTTHRSSPCEINRAWKMMDLAMTIGRNRKRSMPQTSNSPLKKINSSKDVATHPPTVSHNFINKDIASIIPRTPQQNHSPVNNNMRETQILGTQSKNCEQMIPAVPGVMSAKEVDCLPRSDNSRGKTAISLNRGTKEVDCLPGTDNSRGKTAISLNRGLSRSPLAAKSEVPVSCNPSTISPSLAADVPHVNPQCDASPSVDGRFHLSNRDVLDKKCCKGKHVNDVHDAKSEIQSLVKLNLKILNKHHKLEYDAFKQVARTATHSIVAACELEQPKPGYQHFPSSICCHTNDIRQPRRSSLMRNSCRECFYAFVKDVVSNVLNDKRIYRNKE